MRPLSVLFRADAGRQVGLGHLQRCLSLATALCSAGVRCLFLTNEASQILERIRRWGFPGSTLGKQNSWGASDVAYTIATAKAQGCIAIIVDSDYEGPQYLSQLQEAGFFVCAIEDLAPHPFPCQLVVNGDAHARQLSYRALNGDTRFLLGPEYAILRRELWEVPSRAAHDSVRTILVTFGGADPHRLTLSVLDVLDEIPESFVMAAMLGPFFERRTEVDVLAQRSLHTISVVWAADSVRQLMVEADVAVSAGGQTLYELARVGCPAVVVSAAGNQEAQVQVFAERGCIHRVGRAEEPGLLLRVRDAVQLLLRDTHARAAMSTAGQHFIDGGGAQRVAQAIIAEISVAQGNQREW